MQVQNQYSDYPPPNYGDVGEIYDNTPGNAQAQQNDSWSFTQINFNRDSHEFSTYGLRFERANKAYQAGFIRFDGIAGFNLTAANLSTASLSPGLGAKAAVHLGDFGEVYGTAMGTANLSYVDSEWCAGVGTRLAAGATLHLGKGSGLYGEVFKENATNYQAQGYAIGFKRYF